jgi:putative two-component system response regulator
MLSRSLILGAAGGTALYVAQSRRERRIAERLAAAALESLLNAIDANDPQTGAHVRRVAAYAIALAHAAGLDDADVRSIERVALFHDIGKIDAALFDLVHDQSTLSPDERRLIAIHPLRGAQVLQPLAAFYPELPAGVLAHHERWDGSGYPRALRGTAIPLTARVTAIADTFDAITHARRYREGRSVEAAVQAIAEGAGTQFDPALAMLFIQPPVLADMRRALQRARRPRRSGQRRQASNEARELAPDVTFRWRSESPVRRVPDPTR